jgi:LAS superfamily LD-carboxypeptidase LdcB
MIQSILNRQLEREKTQGQLILKAIEAKPDDALINLKFLVDTGLLNDPSGKIREAVDKADKFKQIPSLPTANTSPSGRDYSSKTLDGLQPNVAGVTQQLVVLASKQGIEVRVIKAYVDPDVQRKLYEDWKAGKTQGLTAPPPTAHTEGRAVDLLILDGDKPSMDFERYKKLAEIAKGLGFHWGGDKGGLSNMWHFEVEPTKNDQ